MLSVFCHYGVRAGAGDVGRGDEHQVKGEGLWEDLRGVGG